MKHARLILLAVTVGSFALLVSRKFLDEAAADRRVDLEARLQETEIAECMDRLRLLHRAWLAYRKDHSDQEPPRVESLIPRYLPDASVLTCPTARRLIANGIPVEAGRVEIGGRTYPETYGFLWLTANSSRLLRRGDSAPLIRCSIHHAAAAQADSNGRTVESSTESSPRVQARSNVHDLVVLRNGVIQTVELDED